MSESTLVPCEGGPHSVGWLRVEQPIPLEVDRGYEGIYLLDERDDGSSPVYVYVTPRL